MLQLSKAWQESSSSFCPGRQFNVGRLPVHMHIAFRSVLEVEGGNEQETRLETAA